MAAVAALVLVSVAIAAAQQSSASPALPPVTSGTATLPVSGDLLQPVGTGVTESPRGASSLENANAATATASGARSAAREKSNLRQKRATAGGSDAVCFVNGVGFVPSNGQPCSALEDASEKNTSGAESRQSAYLANELSVAVLTAPQPSDTLGGGVQIGSRRTEAWQLLASRQRGAAASSKGGTPTTFEVPTPNFQRPQRPSGTVRTPFAARTSAERTTGAQAQGAQAAVGANNTSGTTAHTRYEQCQQLSKIKAKTRKEQRLYDRVCSQ